MERKLLQDRVARKLREIRGDMSQEAFAKLVKVSQNQISQYERGVAMPSLRILIQIGQATGADLNEFAGLIETKEGG